MTETEWFISGTRVIYLYEINYPNVKKIKLESLYLTHKAVASGFKHEFKKKIWRNAGYIFEMLN